MRTRRNSQPPAMKAISADEEIAPGPARRASAQEAKDSENTAENAEAAKDQSSSGNPAENEDAAGEETGSDKPKRRRTRKTADAKEPLVETAENGATGDQPIRRGWWQRTFGEQGLGWRPGISFHPRFRRNA